MAAQTAFADGLGHGEVDPRVRCSRGDPCWPTAAEIGALNNTLNPDLPRGVYRANATGPEPCGVPIGSPGDEPFYGLAKTLHPLYAASANEDPSMCFEDAGHVGAFCIASLRNTPKDGWAPAFVAWPLTVQHVQACVAFAAKHNLGVCVVSTGHEFLNRHTCNEGMLIRTTLMKSMEWDNDAGTATLGPGLTWGEVLAAGDEYGRVVETGHAVTVGVVGWSIGGGHSWLGPHLGLGVDQLVSLDVVLANATTVTASNSSNPDLFWALRGGGGSAFGVITSLTIKTYENPKNGFTNRVRVLSGASSPAGLAEFDRLIHGFTNWSLSLSNNWGGYANIQFSGPAPDNNTWVREYLGKFGITSCAEWAATYGLQDPEVNGCPAAQIAASPACKMSPSCEADPFTILSVCPTTCGSPWAITLDYIYWGAATDTEFTTVWGEVDAFQPGWFDAQPPFEMPTYWVGAAKQPIEVITPVMAKPETDAWRFLSSVLITRDDAESNAYADVISAQAASCAGDATQCVGFQAYQTVSGNVGSPTFDPSHTSISAGFRNAFLHLIAVPRAGEISPEDEAAIKAAMYNLGENSYFSESEYTLPGDSWKARYWGDNYAKLAQVKKEWDPTSFFWCRHCVGSDWVPSHLRRV